MKVPAPFFKKETLKNKEEMQAAGTDGKSGQNYKNTQKILEMHETFSYNVTILYSTKYSEL